MKKLIILAALLAASTAQAQVYKCVVNGKKTFSDVPCAADAEKIKIRPSTQQESGAVAESRRAYEKALYKYMERAAAAVSKGEIFVGMLEKDLVASWGRPTKINSDQYGSGTKEQWIYRKPGYADAYVYVDNGAVSAIQQRP